MARASPTRHARADRWRRDLPAVAIVCAFSSDRGLTHGECVQLAHEMGHGLHALLSRTTYSVRAPLPVCVVAFLIRPCSISLALVDRPTLLVRADSTASIGRCSTIMADLPAEIPSHLLERFMWDPRIVSMLCGTVAEVVQDVLAFGSVPRACVGGCSASFRDHVSGQLRARTLFAGLDLQAQVAYAALDQALHGAECTGSPGVRWRSPFAFVTVASRRFPGPTVGNGSPAAPAVRLCPGDASLQHACPSVQLRRVLLQVCPAHAHTWSRRRRLRCRRRPTATCTRE